MASRLLFQRFSGMSRSASLFGANASAAAPQGVFHVTPAHPGMTVPSNSVTGYTARYFNVFPCSHADAKTSLTTTGLSSTTMNNMKPSLLDFGREARTLSSSSSKSSSHKFTMGAEIAAREAKMHLANLKDSIKRIMESETADMALVAFAIYNVVYMLSLEEKNSSCCKCKCNCKCHSNPKVQQD